MGPLGFLIPHELREVINLAKNVDVVFTRNSR